MNINTVFLRDALSYSFVNKVFYMSILTVGAKHQARYYETTDSVHDDKYFGTSNIVTFDLYRTFYTRRSKSSVNAFYLCSDYLRYVGRI